MTEDLLDRARAGDLYAVLALSTIDELDPIVRIITSKTWNYLDVKEEYKRYAPDHTRYHSLIGDELRLYGGNTLANVGRGGAGPTYEELLDDVCWKLSVPYEKGRILENEANLLDIFLERRWQALDPLERERLAASARETALGKTSDSGWYAKVGLSTLAFPFFTAGGVAAFGHSMLDTSYKVTVPCVLHIAYLRRKIIGEGRGAVADPVKRSSTVRRSEPDQKPTSRDGPPFSWTRV